MSDARIALEAQRPGESRRATTARAFARLLGEGVEIDKERCPSCGLPHGRPLLRGREGQAPHLSVAHTETHTLVAVAEVPVGIDLEAADRDIVADPPVRVPDDSSPLQHWTRIEAVVKADGRGLRIDPASLVWTPTTRGFLVSVPDAASYEVTDVRLDGFISALALLS